MKPNVYNRNASVVAGQRDRLANIIKSETRFGIGPTFKNRRDHDVMGDRWAVSPVTRHLRDKAWTQLGTGGSGNHFVEFGAFTVTSDELDLPNGKYLALLSHSDSCGTGAQLCDTFSKRAMARRSNLPKELKHLAWFSHDKENGQEYWNALNLMGRCAAANHELIHKHIGKNLGAYGTGQPESLNSASHGAGRVMSRTKELQSFTWSGTKNS